MGQRGLLVCTPSFFTHSLPRVRSKIQQKVEINTQKFSGECCDEEIQRLKNIAKDFNSQFIAGIGGGKTIDTVKAIAHELTIPVCVVPTIASTDAPCSALSVIYTSQGEFNRYLKLHRNPDLVLVDTHIIAHAPVRFLISGMGDALATWFEAESCQKKHAKNMAGGYGSMSAYSLAHLCYKTLLEYGLAAKVSCETQSMTPALEHIVEANTLLSGLGFESGGLAAAHAIHDGLTILEETHNYYHGEKVAIGTLTSLFLTGKPAKVIDEVFSFCERVGLPTTLEEIGVRSFSEEDLLKVGQASCAKQETIHNEPLPVTPELVVSSLRAAHAEGKRRKLNKEG